MLSAIIIQGVYKLHEGSDGRMYTHGQLLWLVLQCRQTYIQAMFLICIITQIGQKKANIQKSFNRCWIKKAHLQANLLKKCFSHTENFIRQTALQVAGYISTVHTHSITQVVFTSCIIGLLRKLSVQTFDGATHIHCAPVVFPTADKWYLSFLLS